MSEPEWDTDDYLDTDDEDESPHTLPTGSCDECGADLFHLDPDDGLCNQCSWHADAEYDLGGSD